MSITYRVSFLSNGGISRADKKSFLTRLYFLNKEKFWIKENRVKITSFDGSFFKLIYYLFEWILYKKKLHILQKMDSNCKENTRSLCMQRNIQRMMLTVGR